MGGDTDKKKPKKDKKEGDSTGERSSKKQKKLKPEQEQATPAAGAPTTEKKQKKKHQEQQAAATPADDAQQQLSEKKAKKKHKQEAAAAAAATQQVASQQQGDGASADPAQKKRKHQQEQQQSAKKQKQQQDSTAAAQEHLTVSIQVPAAADKAVKKTKQQQQLEQQQVAAAGPWLVYMAAPDPSVYSKLQFKAYVPQGGTAADKGMVLLSEQEGTTLIGSTKSNINEPAAQFGGYAVGVYDKQTNTLQLAKPAGGSVVRVEAVASQAGPVDVSALSKPAQQSMEQQQAAKAARHGPQDAAARRAQATRLVEQFGSTRRKRQLAQRAEGTVVVTQNAAAAELDVMMQEVQRRAQAAGNTREEIMGRLAANRVIPAHNPLATTPQEAYQPRVMFGEALLSAVNMGQMLYAADDADSAEQLKSKVPGYVVHRLQRVRDAGGNQAERKRRARLLALLAALIRLASGRPKLVVRAPKPALEGEEGDARSARPGGLEKLAASLRIGRQQVLQLLLDKFYDKRMEEGHLVYFREAKQEQLLLMHLLVVALDLEGWRMAPQQFEMLRRELKTTPADVVTRFRELGCTTSAVRIQMASEGAAEVTTTMSYNVALLASGDKTLAQSFPKPKVMKKAGAR